MEKHAIVIIYHGTEASKEAVRGAIEALTRHGVNMETQTVSPHVLNENEIAMAIIAHATPKDNIEVDSGFNMRCARICNVINEDVRITTVINKYVLSRICIISNEFSKDVDALYKTEAKLQVKKQVKEKCNLSIKDANDLVDALFDVVQKCQGRIVE